MRWIVRGSHALAAAALFSVFSTGAALAQGVTTGAISGKVTDPQGQPVAQAAVQITHRRTGYTTSVRTRENGQYLVQGLEVGGPYTVTVRAIGFQAFTRDNVDVNLSEATKVNAQLIAQAVELSAVQIAAPATADFTPTRTGVATQISDTLVQRIPTFSRDFVDQLKLTPQVTYPATGAASGRGRTTATTRSRSTARTRASASTSARPAAFPAVARAARSCRSTRSRNSA